MPAATHVEDSQSSTSLAEQKNGAPELKNMQQTMEVTATLGTAIPPTTAAPAVASAVPASPADDETTSAPVDASIIIVAESPVDRHGGTSRMNRHGHQYINGAHEHTGDSDAKWVGMLVCCIIGIVVIV